MLPLCDIDTGVCKSLRPKIVRNDSLETRVVYCYILLFFVSHRSIIWPYNKVSENLGDLFGLLDGGFLEDYIAFNIELDAVVTEVLHDVFNCKKCDKICNVVLLGIVAANMRLSQIYRILLYN